LGSESRRPSSRSRSEQAALFVLSGAWAFWGALALSCAGGTAGAAGPERAEGVHADAPLVASQPGAWFDANGNLTVVGAGRRLRLVLSAPIAACSPAFQVQGDAADVSTRASLPFHVLDDVCRDQHPSILLAEESETASPSELERSYHEVARCAVTDWRLTDGWIPSVVASSDPCPLALGLGWRLPRTAELQGLTLDDRKALAGALFDADERSDFGGLLLYARAPGGELTLATLSPNSAEVAPALDEASLRKPFFGATLRCVRDAGPAPGVSVRPPVLAGAGECLRTHRKAQERLTTSPAGTTLPELQQLKTWIDLAHRAPQRLRSESELKALLALLAAPALDDLAKKASEERVLTERYAELAESLDDPTVSAAERQRRHAEFDHLRKRLGGQIVQSAEAMGGQGTALGAVLLHLQRLLQSAATIAKASRKAPLPDYQPIFTRLRELDNGKALAP
jgi:hypothetical protein